jgi:hypothetical protein
MFMARVPLLVPRHARACRGHPRRLARQQKQDVDGRDKPGHHNVRRLARFVGIVTE